MKKAITVLIGIGIILTLAGCTGKQSETSAGNSIVQTVTVSQDDTGLPSGNSGKDEVKFKAAIAEVHLGDSVDDLSRKFGPAIRETPLEEPNYMGEKVSKIEYKNGVSIFADKKTNTVLEITAEAGDYETNLGIKLGNSAEEVYEKYNTKYPLFKGDNSDDYLQGWYVVEEGELLIFDFKKDDDTHYNEKIGKDEKVVSITLSHPKYFD